MGCDPRRLLILLCCLLLIQPARAYSVLSHEAIIDAVWLDRIQPLLLKRFPNTAPDDLKTAQAYAYGGAIIQDMGYYPFGSKFFSDLGHYVRSGAFVMNLLNEAQDVDEYAFALGSLAHYAADNQGHPDAINRVVPVMFPKLKKKFGQVVTYEDNPADHLKVEFSFDVIQVAQGHYAPQAYHSMIGFQVSKPVLERAFAKTYSLELHSLFKSEDLAIGSYRYAISSILPEMTKASWDLKKDDIQKTQPGATRAKFIYNISRSDYRKEWGRTYERPGIGARFLATILRILPKIGPLRALAFKAPPAESETVFLKSFNATLAEYRRLLTEHGQGTLQLPDQNFDTGKPTKGGAYRMADDAYAKLVEKLNGKPISPDLRADILAYYSDLNAPFSTKSDSKSWKKLLKDLDKLKSTPAVSPAAAAEAR